MAVKATAEATLVVTHANSPLKANKLSYQHSLTYQRQTQPPININADQHEQQQAITNQTLAANVEQHRQQQRRQKRIVTLSSPIVDGNIFKNDNNNNSKNLSTTDSLLNCLLIFALISSIVNVSLISFVVKTIQVDQGNSNLLQLQSKLWLHQLEESSPVNKGSTNLRRQYTSSSSNNWAPIKLNFPLSLTRSLLVDSVSSNVAETNNNDAENNSLPLNIYAAPVVDYTAEKHTSEVLVLKSGNKQASNLLKLSKEQILIASNYFYLEKCNDLNRQNTNLPSKCNKLLIASNKSQHQTINLMLMDAAGLDLQQQQVIINPRHQTFMVNKVMYSQNIVGSEKQNFYVESRNGKLEAVASKQLAIVSKGGDINVHSLGIASLEANKVEIKASKLFFGGKIKVYSTEELAKRLVDNNDHDDHDDHDHEHLDEHQVKAYALVSVDGLLVAVED